MNQKLKNALLAMVIVMMFCFIFGIIIQTIGDAFHVAWRIMPNIKFIGEYKLYYMLMISFWFILPFTYLYEICTKKRYSWQSRRSYIFGKITGTVMMVLCIYMWYGTIIGYQTKFLM